MILTERPAVFNPKFEVAACYMEYDGKILLLHRQDHKKQGNTWAVLGGKIHEGESPEETMLREIEEEIGVRFPEAPRFHSTVFGTHYGYDYILHMFHHILPEPIEIQLNLEEHKAYQWLPVSEALTMPLMIDEDECIKLIYSL